MSKLLILNCDYDTAPETNGAQLIRARILHDGSHKVRIESAFSYGGIPASALNWCDAAVITGSRASTYERKRWVRNLQSVIRRLDGAAKPVLGICFGYQIVAAALGGRVARGAVPEEGFKYVTLNSKGAKSPLFRGMPSRFAVYQSHNDVVTRLPAGAAPLAKSLNSLQAYSVRSFSCVQFHPEIGIATARRMARRDGIPISKIMGAVRSGYSLHYKVLGNFISQIDPAGL